MGDSQYAVFNGILFYAANCIGDITIPDGVNIISAEVFCSCDQITSVTLPDSVEWIEYGAFSDCTNLSSINIPDSVCSIDAMAFANSGLESIVLPDSIVYISYEVFRDCTKLKNVTLPKYIEYFNSACFANTPWLESIKGDTTFAIYNGILFDGSGSSGDIVIPNSVKKISIEAFALCEELTSVCIPDSVEEIESTAFYNCPKLCSVSLPNSITSIEFATFQDCKELCSVNIPDSVTHIGSWAFLGCDNLMSITIPASVTDIEWGAVGWQVSDEGEWNMIDGFTIYGYTGTAAETYANENGFNFVELSNEPVYGDVNCDGEIDISDAIILERFCAEDPAILFNAYQKGNADCNKDGKISAKDTATILKMIAKLI